MSALADIQAERARVRALGYTADLPDGTGRQHTGRRNRWQLARDTATKRGAVTFRHVLAEKVAEAFAESDPARLRAELVQVAAVALRWIEAIDARGAKGTTT